MVNRILLKSLEEQLFNGKVIILTGAHQTVMRHSKKQTV